MRVCVLYGGISNERAVSLASGRAIAEALVRRGYRVALVDLAAPVSGAPEDLFVRELPDAAADTCGKTPVGAGVETVVRAADVVVPALHGGIGEDGTLQALLAAWGTPFAGSDACACRTAMRKHKTKELLVTADIPTAPWVSERTSTPFPFDACERTVGYPAVVKPNSGGSSVGMQIVRDRAELEAAVAMARAYDTRVLVERFVAGRECSVGVLGGMALPPVEILAHGFYDYKRKYETNTRLVCPAAFDAVTTEKLTHLARRVYTLCGMRDYARVDFLLPERGAPVCLEVNALPGMTSHSLFPLAARAAGIDFDSLCDKMVRMAAARA